MQRNFQNSIIPTAVAVDGAAAATAYCEFRYLSVCVTAVAVVIATVRRN